MQNSVLKLKRKPFDANLKLRQRGQMWSVNAQQCFNALKYNPGVFMVYYVECGKCKQMYTQMMRLIKCFLYACIALVYRT